eukprot:2670028-Pyramimonas_sp.AAC.1
MGLPPERRVAATNLQRAQGLSTGHVPNGAIARTPPADVFQAWRASKMEGGCSLNSGTRLSAGRIRCLEFAAASRMQGDSVSKRGSCMSASHIYLERLEQLDKWRADIFRRGLSHKRRAHLLYKPATLIRMTAGYR